MWLLLYLISFEIYLSSYINKNVKIKNKNGYNQFLEKKNYNLMNRHLHFRYKQHKLRVTCLKKT